MRHERSFYFGLRFSGSNLSKGNRYKMEKQELRFARELEMSSFYEGVNIGTRRVDFFVEDKIMTELKAVSHLDDTNLNQAINYLEAYNLQVGLLLNFGSKKLEFKRTYNNKHPDNAGHVKKHDLS